MVNKFEGSRPCNIKDNRNNIWRRVVSVVAAIALSFPLRGVFKNDMGIETRNNKPQSKSSVTDCGPDITPTKMPETINDYVPETVTKIYPTPAPNSRPGLPTPSPTEPVVINTDSSKVPSSSQRVNL